MNILVSYVKPSIDLTLKVPASAISCTCSGRNSCPLFSRPLFDLNVSKMKDSCNCLEQRRDLFLLHAKSYHGFLKEYQLVTYFAVAKATYVAGKISYEILANVYQKFIQ